jgi:hypothetical protein
MTLEPTATLERTERKDVMKLLAFALLLAAVLPATAAAQAPPPR